MRSRCALVVGGPSGQARPPAGSRFEPREAASRPSRYYFLRANMAHSVNVAIEAPIENQIQEISYDGTEIYQQ